MGIEAFFVIARTMCLYELLFLSPPSLVKIQFKMKNLSVGRFLKSIN